MNMQYMEPIARSDVIEDKGFIHQIKWDGIRGIISIDGESIIIRTKKGNICTKSYPELATIHEQITKKEAILDGEIVVFKDSKPSFIHTLKRSSTHTQLNIKHAASAYPAKYIVFDILMLDGISLKHLTLKKRQSILKLHFNNSSTAALAENFDDGAALYKSMRENNMEGIVSKRLNSIYSAGKNHIDWYKTKITKKMLCIVIGARKKHGQLSSIILGIYRDNKLINVGHTYSGLKQRDLRLLMDYMQKKKTEETEDYISVMPELTCWVQFTEWTANGSLRHPVLLGFSDENPNSATGKEDII